MIRDAHLGLDTVAVYQPKLYIRLLSSVFAIIFIPLILLQFSIATNTDIPLPMILFFLFVTGIAVSYTVMLWTAAKMTITQQGIEIQNWSSRLFVRWDEMQELKTRRRNKNTQRGIQLHHNVKWQGGLFGLHTRFLQLDQYITMPIRSHNLLFTRVDIPKFKNTEFGQMLYTYAPHLFDEVSEKKK